MSKIVESNFSQIGNGKALTVADLEQDRKMIASAINDNQEQIFRIIFGALNTKVFNSKNDLSAFASPVDLDYAAVLSDETLSSNCVLYQYQTNTWVVISNPFSLKDLVLRVDAL